MMKWKHLINSRKLFHPGKYWASVVVEALWEKTNRAEQEIKRLELAHLTRQRNLQTLSVGGRTAVLEGHYGVVRFNLWCLRQCCEGCTSAVEQTCSTLWPKHSERRVRWLLGEMETPIGFLRIPVHMCKGEKNPRLTSLSIDKWISVSIFCACYLRSCRFNKQLA